MPSSLWKKPKTIALISPAGATPSDVREKSIERLEQLGIKVHKGKHIAASKRRYLAGSTSERLEDLYDAYARDDIDAVWCLRGGYGSAQLISRIEWSRLARAKEIPLVGYSDITALLIAFKAHGLKAIHGSVVTELCKLDYSLPESELENTPRWKSLASIGNALDSTGGELAVENPDNLRLEGELVGGNLTMLASLCGTDGALKLTKPSILLLEDISEPFYALERSFFQVIDTLDTSMIRAICLGEFNDCSDPDDTISLESIFSDWISDTGIPLLKGLPIGHGNNNHAWGYRSHGSLSGNKLYWQY